MLISAKKSWYKRISIVIIIGVVIFVFSLAMTKAVYDRVFARHDDPVDIPPALHETTQKRQVCHFRSGEHLLAGYYYGGTAPEKANGLLVLVPGFHAGGDNYLWQIHELLEYGWNVFTFDSTGTLNSEGESQIGFSQTVLDLKAALKFLDD